MFPALRKRTFAVVTLLALGVAACGAGDDDGGAAETAAEERTAERPPGEPLRVAQWGPTEGFTAGQDLFAAAEAAVEEINAAGGIPDPAGGPNRPLELVECRIDIENQVDDGARCAREAIEADVLAVNGKYFGDSMPVVEAGIPVVSIYPNTEVDQEHELSFPIAGGTGSMSLGLGVALQSEGAETVGLMLADSANARGVPPLVASSLENGEDDLSTVVYTPLDPSADITSFAAEIANENPDGVAVVNTPEQLVKSVRALREAGYEGLIASASFSVLPEQIEQLGDLAEGLIVVSDFGAATTTGDETIDAFNAAMDEHAPDAPRSMLGVGSWVSMQIIADALSNAETLDAAGLAAALQGLEVDYGTVPPFVVGESGLESLPFPRVPRDTVQFQVVRDGDIEPIEDGEFYHLDGED